MTTVLVELDGQTTFTVTSLFPSQEVRDMLIKAGMTSGAAETFDKLAEYRIPSSTVRRWRPDLSFSPWL